MAFSFPISIVHAVTAVFCAVELGLTAYLISIYDSFFGAASAPSQINFMLFNSILSLLVLAYIGLAPLYYAHFFHKLASVGLECILMIFWFSGAISLAVITGGPYNCGSDRFCGSLEAAVAFGFFTWAAFVVLSVVDLIGSLRSRNHASKTNPTIG